MKLKGREDEHINHSGKTQRKLKTWSKETQDDWNFAKISAERKHHRFKKEAPQET